MYSSYKFTSCEGPLTVRQEQTALQQLDFDYFSDQSKERGKSVDELD